MNRLTAAADWTLETAWELSLWLTCGSGLLLILNWLGRLIAVN